MTKTCQKLITPSPNLLDSYAPCHNTSVAAAASLHNTYSHFGESGRHGFVPIDQLRAQAPHATLLLITSWKSGQQYPHSHGTFMMMTTRLLAIAHHCRPQRCTYNQLAISDNQVTTKNGDLDKTLRQKCAMKEAYKVPCPWSFCVHRI